MLGAVFRGADIDGDGLLSRADLTGALKNMGSSAWWPWQSQVDIDVESVVAEVDLDHTGGISYTEFIASSIYARYESFELLACQAFRALDTDRDGLVRVPEVIGLFRERDMPLLGKLPQHRPFQQVEWCAALEQHARAERHAGSVGQLASHPSFSHRRVRTMP